MPLSQTNQPAALIATLGSEAQVVTCGLDLLLRRGEDVRRVIVLHTQDGGVVFDAVNRLHNEFERGGFPAGVSLRFTPLAAHGQALADVQTPQASEAAFQALYSCIWTAKRGGDAVHLLIAGGRKNLAIHAMVAAQMLFDDRDRLWHLYSAGDFLESKRLHPRPGDDVHLLDIPVLLRNLISPALGELSQVEDARQALDKLRRLDLEARLSQARGFVLGSLTHGEARVVELLVRAGAGDAEIAAKLCLSARTVEQHLRAAYQKAANHWELESVNRAQLIALLSLYYSFHDGGREDTGKYA